LGLGSYALQRAVRSVRQERQQQFRNWLRAALVLGSLFIGVQSYGLWSIFPQNRDASDASLGATPFIIVLVALHGIHFLVAVLFVCFVAARAAAHRYDHEYYWGVLVCSWFWHVLGIIWLGILCVFAIVL
jgi:cytochrome c oxidase subunit 3